MKKIMLVSLLAVSSVASVAFAVQLNQKNSVRRAPTCKKVILTCPDGVTTYYKCILGSTNSPDCYYDGSPLNEGCNITEYPCRR